MLLFRAIFVLAALMHLDALLLKNVHRYAMARKLAFLPLPRRAATQTLYSSPVPDVGVAVEGAEAAVGAVEEKTEVVAVSTTETAVVEAPVAEEKTDAAAVSASMEDTTEVVVAEGTEAVPTVTDVAVAVTAVAAVAAVEGVAAVAGVAVAAAGAVGAVATVAAVVGVAGAAVPGAAVVAAVPTVPAVPVDAVYYPVGTTYCMCSQCKTAYLMTTAQLGRGARVQCGICNKDWYQTVERLMTTSKTQYITGMGEGKIKEVQRILADKNFPRYPRVDKVGVFVGNLPYTYGEKELADLFAEYGLTNISLVTDNEQQSKGFAFLEVSSVVTVRR
jgi:predicted Zn finger-like uncharacterized protein